MAIIGISLIVASVVLFCLRPPAWLPNLLASLTQPRLGGPAARSSPPPVEQPEDEHVEPDAEEEEEEEEEEEAEPRPDSEVNEVKSLSQPPAVVIQEEPLVEIEVTDAPPLEQDMEKEDMREDEHMLDELDKLDELDEQDDEQTTPKATATARDDPVPSLVLPVLSTPSPHTESVEHISPPSFAMTPPPTFNIEPDASSEPAHEEREREHVAPQRILSPPQLNFVAPEQASPPAASSPSPSPSLPPPQPTNKSPSDLMPPPPLPKPKVPKTRTSGIPLPASSSSSSPSSYSSPVRRIPSLPTAGSPSSPTPASTRIPSPPTARHIPAPTINRASPAAAALPTAPTTTTPANRIPTLSGLPRRASPTPSTRTLPIPRRGAPTPSGGGLMPPPTASSIPKKPSRQVSLQPGHSPLDWARLAQTPTSDLRNLPPDTPYLRVPPSLLRQHNGRKGRDAWSAYGGKVYNVTPYLAFHPGGGPELLRGAGKDATRLFAEVHPWVNYETMLQSCLIGLLVDEAEAEVNAMEEMD